MPERVKDDQGNEYYSVDGKEFSPIERVTGDDGVEYEKLGEDWVPVSSTPSVTQEQMPTPSKNAISVVGAPVVQEQRSPEQSPIPIVGAGIKPYAEMSLNERLSAYGLKPTGDKEADTKRLEKAERRGRKLATLATRPIMASPVASLPFVSEEAGLAVGKGLTTMARAVPAVVEQAYAGQRKIVKALPENVQKSVEAGLQNDPVFLMAKNISASGKKVGESIQEQQMPTAPQFVVDPDTGTAYETSTMEQVADPWKWIQVAGEEAPWMAINIASGGKAGFITEPLRALIQEQDEAEEYFKSKYGMTREEALDRAFAPVVASSITQGAFSATLDKAFIGNLFKSPAKTLTGRVARIAGLGGQQYLEEAGASIISGVGQKVYNPEKTWREIWRQANVEGIFGLGLGGGISIGATIGAKPQDITPVVSDQEIIPTEPEQQVEPSREEAAEIASKWIEELNAEQAALIEQAKADEGADIEPRLAGMREYLDRQTQIDNLKGLLDTQTAVLEGIRDGELDPSVLPQVLAPTANSGMEGAKLVADIEEMRVASERLGLDEVAQAVDAIHAEADLAVLNGDDLADVVANAEKKIEEAIRPVIVEEINNLPESFRVDGVDYKLNTNEAIEFHEAKRQSQERMALIRRNADNLTKEERASAYRAEGERFANLKREFARQIEGERNEIARRELGVSEELGTPELGPQEQAAIDEAGVRPEDSGVARPEVQRFIDVVSQSFPRLTNGVRYAIETNNAVVDFSQDVDGNELMTMSWEDDLGRNRLFQVTMIADNPTYVDSSISEFEWEPTSYYIHHINAVHRGRGASPVAYRNIAQVMQANRPDIELATGVIASRGSFLGRLPYVSSNFNPVNGMLETTIDDLATMNMVPGWDKNIANKAWDAYEAGNTALARDLVQSARGETGIEYLAAGMNPFAVVDSVLGAAGLPTMRQRLGINWETATAKDYWEALVKAINGLGSSIRETSAKIRNKWNDLPENIIRKIAEFAHTFTQDGVEPKVPETLIDKDPVVTAQKAFRAITPNDLVVAGIPKADADRIVAGIPNADFRNELKRIGVLTKMGAKNATWIGQLMSPDQYALRNMERMAPVDRGIQNRKNDRNSFKRMFEDVVELAAEIERKPEQNQILGIALATASLPRQDGKVRPWTKEELKRAFPLMHDQTVNAYFKIRDAIKKATNLRLGALIRRTGIYRTRLERQMRDPKTPLSKRGTMQKAIEQLNESEAALRNTLNNPEYWPLSRFGNFRWDLYDKKGQRIVTLFTDDSGDAGRREAAQQLRVHAAINPTVKALVESGEYNWNIEEPLNRPIQLPKLDPALKNSGGMLFDTATAKWAMAATRVGNELGISDDIGLLMSIGVTQSYLDEFTKKHELKRQGIPGWSTDAGRILRATINSYANEFAANNNGIELEDAMIRLGQEKAGRLYDAQLENEAKKQMRWEAAPPYSPATNAILTYGFIQALGGVPAFAVVNTLQQPMIHLRYFGKFYGYAEASKAIALADAIAVQFVQWHRLEDYAGKSAAEIGQMIDARLDSILNERLIGWFAGKQGDAVAIKETVKQALKQAMVAGETAPNTSEELMISSYNPALGRFGQAANRFLEAYGYMASKTERVNRTSAIIAAAMLGAKHGFVNTHDGGWSLEKIGPNTQTDPDREWAGDVAYRSSLASRNVNFPSQRGNLSPWQRITGNVAQPLLKSTLMFKRFMVNAITLTHQLGVLDARNVQGADAKAKIEQTARYVRGQMVDFGITALLAGPNSFWMLGLLSYMIKVGLGEDEWYKFWNEFRDEATKQIKDAMPGDTEDEKRKFAHKLLWSIESGQANWAGIDLHNAIAANLFMTPDGTPSQKAAYAIGGAPFGSILKTLDAREKTGGTTQTALENLIPRAPKNLKQAIDGKMRFMGDLGPTYEPGDRVLKALSFMPTTESRFQEQVGQQFAIYRMRNDKVNNLKDMLKREVRNAKGDSDKEAAAFEKVSNEMNTWNESKQYWVDRLEGKFKPIRMREVMYSVKPKEAEYERIMRLAGLLGEETND